MLTCSNGLTCRGGEESEQQRAEEGEEGSSHVRHSPCIYICVQ